MTETFGMATKALEDINKTRNLILMSALVALILGMFWMIIMKMCAGVITWLAIILLIVGLLGLTYFMY